MAVGVAGVDVDGTGQRIVLFYSCFFRAMLIEGMKMEMSPSADAACLVAKCTPESFLVCLEIDVILGKNQGSFCRQQ